MADGTLIEWTDASWNPIRARNRETGKAGWFCTHESDGCRFCYAETFNHRLGTGIDYRAQDLDKIEIFVDEKILLQPLHWRRPRKIFTLSMSDLFGPFISDEQIDKVFAVMALAPQHTFQVLTKRAERMRDYVTSVTDDRIRFSKWAARGAYIARAAKQEAKAPPRWPLSKVWLGVSVEDQTRADERIPILLDAPAAVRFISAEPLLGPIDLSELPIPHGHVNALTTETTTFGNLIDAHALASRYRTGIDWVIVGGESGPRARPMQPDWARSLRDQCNAAGVAFFLKQWGEYQAVDEPDGNVVTVDGHAIIAYSHGDYIRVGKKAAGRLLDGRDWSEFPK